MYKLPKLQYSYKALRPFLSEKQLKIHHTNHHKAYTDNTNKILKQIQTARKKKQKTDMKNTLKSLGFNLGGHILHEKFWENLAQKGKGGKLGKKLQKAINKEFGTFQQFKQEFSSAAKSIEGSGWAALSYCKKNNKLLIMQIEKHNLNIYPMFQLLLVLDMWEHAYYLDYKNDKGKYIEKFWNHINWNKINKRFGR